MATGGISRYKTSEETFDYTCSVCSKKNRVSEAVKHCQECHKYLCTSCLEQHNEYHEDHTLVEPTDATGSGVVMPTEKCREHKNKLVELWCKQHDEVLCNICVIKNHRSCGDVKFIHEEIDNLLKDPELRNTIVHLKSTTAKLGTLKNKQRLKEEDLLNEKKKYIDMVEQQKRKIIDLVKSLGEAAVEEIYTWYNDNKCKVNEAKVSRDKLERDMNSCIQQLDSSSENKSQMFVSMKKGQKLIQTTEAFVCEREKQMKQDKIYEISREIEEHLVTLQSLGSFQKRNHLYKATGSKKVFGNISQDSDVCNINGSCILPDGSILLTDNNNKKLKRLDSSTYTVTNHIDLPGYPWSVCCVGQQEVAVSLSFSRKIQFVSVGNKMTLINTLKVKHYCAGMCYSDGELFISDAGKHVYVYNLTGTLLKIINQTPSGETLFSKTRHLAVNGDRVYVADIDNGLVCVNRNATELYRYRGTQVKGGWGVCTDGQGGVFLFGHESHNVVQIDEDGEELGVVLTQADGLNNPRSLCFDPRKNKLIIGNSNPVFLFDLK